MDTQGKPVLEALSGPYDEGWYDEVQVRNNVKLKLILCFNNIKEWFRITWIIELLTIVHDFQNWLFPLFTHSAWIVILLRFGSAISDNHDNSDNSSQKESRATLACSYRTSGWFYMLQLISVDSRHFKQPELSLQWSDLHTIKMLAFAISAPIRQFTFLRWHHWLMLQNWIVF